MAATGLCRAEGLGMTVSPQLRLSKLQVWVLSDETLDQIDFPNAVDREGAASGGEMSSIIMRGSVGCG